MTDKQIETYGVLHYPDGKIRINLHFTDGSGAHYDTNDPNRALLLVDVLRNEKPIWWTVESEILWTGAEAVGVGEE